jgi:hypothetical protein
VVLAGCSLFLLALATLHQFTRQDISSRERYMLPFAEVNCSAPAGWSRQEFLAEVQYLAGLPDRLQLLDDDLPERLALAFAEHPWVAKVDSVRISPPRRVDVALHHRVPVLRVVVHGHDGPASISSPPSQTAAQTSAPKCWLVDRSAVLLGCRDPGVDLPCFRVAVPPKERAGRQWNDPSVKAAAGVAGNLHDYQDRLRLQELEMDSEKGIVLHLAPDSRVTWGSEAALDTETDAVVSEKVKRILAWIANPPAARANEKQTLDLHMPARRD